MPDPGSDVDAWDVSDIEPVNDADAESKLVCEPGAGAFGCECRDGADCLSAYCVMHLGDFVCTRACEPACPDGWRCGQVSATDPTALCVSKHPYLCLPCGASDECHDVGGTEVCVVYGPAQGSFCGGECETDSDCPSGYACADVTTTEGKDTRRCTPTTGECRCSRVAVDGLLSTPCPITNQWGTCQGERDCTPVGLTACSAKTPKQEACYDGQDNDCDDLVDVDDHEDCDKPCVCGDGECETDRCGEGWDGALKTCASDCAECGNGTCDPGEGPLACAVDCCGGCGDGKCRGGECGESPETCAQDCDFVCGDGACEPGEGPSGCPQDCAPHACGNQVCEVMEGPDTCPQDCGAACGDCACEPPEDYRSCPVDCGYCGDGVCASRCAYLLAESVQNCPADCCLPTCAGKECGDDGCGGTCGACVAGKACVQGACACVQVGGSDVTCDGVDDDCDGGIDEEYVGAATSCGKGACASEGRMACLQGVETDACQPKEPAAEICNGLDDDCDEETDEGDDLCLPGYACVSGVCQPTCVADCAGKECADDGCGGECGTCGLGRICTNGTCQRVSPGVLLRTLTVEISSDGLAGSSLDVDGNPATCAPSTSCEAGIDNAAGPMLGTLFNASLSAAISGGDWMLFLALASQSQGAPAFLGLPIGSLDAAVSPSCDVTTDACDYTVPFEQYTSDCLARTFFDNAVVSGATLTAGGAACEVSLLLPFKGPDGSQAEPTWLALSLRQARLHGTLSWGPTGIGAFDGTLAGATTKQVLKDFVSSVPTEYFQAVSKEAFLSLLDAMLSPDIESDGDGVRDSVSIGFPLHAVAQDRSRVHVAWEGACATDSDLDGDPDATDCAPFDGEVHGGAPDTLCDGVDDDCDGVTDENAICDDGDSLTIEDKCHEGGICAGIIPPPMYLRSREVKWISPVLIYDFGEGPEDVTEAVGLQATKQIVDGTYQGDSVPTPLFGVGAYSMSYTGTDLVASYGTCDDAMLPPVLTCTPEIAFPSASAAITTWATSGDCVDVPLVTSPCFSTALTPMDSTLIFGTTLMTPLAMWFGANLGPDPYDTISTVDAVLFLSESESHTTQISVNDSTRVPVGDLLVGAPSDLVEGVTGWWLRVQYVTEPFGTLGQVSNGLSIPSYALHGGDTGSIGF